MSTKLKIKMGHIEFEYEGDAVYDNEAVKDLFSHIETLMSAAPAGAFESPMLPPSGNGDDVDTEVGDLANLGIQTVAARLNVKTGSDMAVAAAAHLQICQGKNSFNRKDLLASMKLATGYYSDVMSGNLSKILKVLVSAKRINSLSGGQMSLAASETNSLKAKLAES